MGNKSVIGIDFGGNQIKKILSFMCAVLMFFGTGISPYAMLGGFSLNITWDDNNDQYGFRPDELNYKVTSSTTGEQKKSGKLNQANGWKSDFDWDTDWGNALIDVDGVQYYYSSTRTYGSTVTKTYTCQYNDASDTVNVQTVWLDNNNASGIRPDSYNISVSDKFGTSKNYTIGQNETEYQITDFVFAKDGVMNVLNLDTDGIAGYTTNIKKSTGSYGTRFTITHTQQGIKVDPFAPGYQTVQNNSITYSLYKMSGNEKIALLSTPVNEDGTFPVADLSSFKRPGMKIKAIMNASSFVTSGSKATVNGRIQGYTTNSGSVNITTDGPNEGVSGKKPYMDFVIEQPGNTSVFGDFNKGDYADFPESVVLGVSPKAVMSDKNDVYSDVVSGDVPEVYMTNKNSQAAIVRTADNSLALVATSANVAPRGEFKSFMTSYYISEMAVLDSGASVQMSVNGTPVISSSVNVPNTIVIYEEEDIPVVEKTVTIKFHDTDENNPVDLSEYTIIKTFTGESVETGVATVVNTLKNKKFDIADSAWEDYKVIQSSSITGDSAEYTVDVAHTFQNNHSEENKTYTRTIRFVDDKTGNAIANPVVQSLKATIVGETQTDLVVNKTRTIDDETVWENDNSIYPEMTIPTIEGYRNITTAISSVNIRTLPDADRNMEFTVRYEKLDNIVTVLVEFQDTDETDPTDMTGYSKTYEVNVTKHENADLTPIYSRLESENYIIKNKPVVDGKNLHVVIPVEHAKEFNHNSYDCGHSIINLEYTDSKEPENFVVYISGLQNTSTVKDLVTGKTTTTNSNTCHFDAIPSPVKEGYTPDPEIIPGFNIGETSHFPKKIIYTPIAPDTNTINVTFNDVSDDKQDLSGYTKVFAVKKDETVALDISEQISTLEGKNYIVEKDGLPETIGYDSADIVVNVSHKENTQKTEEGRNEFIREIRFLNTEQQKIKDSVIQKAVKINILTTVTDLVTGKTLSKEHSSEWENGKNWFDRYQAPEIERYTSTALFIDQAAVDENTAMRYADLFYEKVSDIHTFTVKFTDTNAKPVDLSGYTKTYDVEMDGNTETTLPEADAQINVVKNAGFKVVSRPEKVSVSNPTLEVKVDHVIEHTENKDVRVGKRTISFSGIEKNDLIQAPDVTFTYAVTTDKVTGESSSVLQSIDGKYVQYTPENVDGYTAKPAVVPEMTIDSETKMDVSVVVTYTKDAEPVPETPDITKSTISSSAFFDNNQKEMVTDKSISFYTDVRMENLVPGTTYVVRTIVRDNGIANGGDANNKGEILNEKTNEITADEETEFLIQQFGIVGDTPFPAGQEFLLENELSVKGQSEHIDDSASGNNRVIRLIGKDDPQPEIPDITKSSITSDAAFANGKKEMVTGTVIELESSARMENLIPGTTYSIHTVVVDNGIAYGGDNNNKGEIITEKTIDFVPEESTHYILTKFEFDEETPYPAGQEFLIENELRVKGQIEHIDDSASGNDRILRLTAAVDPSFTMKVDFMDIDIDKTDLSEYTVEKIVNPEISRIIDLSEEYALLKNKGYEFDEEFDGTIRYEDGDSDYTVPVSHKKTERASAVNVPVKRTIHFVGIEREDAVQSTDIERITEFLVDEVTRKEIITNRRLKGEIPAYNVEPVEDMHADKSVIPAYVYDNIDPEEIKTEIETIVTFTPNAENMHDVRISFIDMNADPQDLSEYDIVKHLVYGESEQIDLSNEIKDFEAKGYIVTNENEIPQEIGDNSADIVVKLDHDVKENTAMVTADVVRNIRYTGVTRDPDMQKAMVKRIVTTKTDAVTHAELEKTETVEGTIPAFKVPEITGYTPSVTEIPEIVINNAEMLDKNFDETVNYKKNQEQQFISIFYKDINDDSPVDLSNYVDKVEYKEDFNIRNFSSDTTKNLQERHFVLAKILKRGNYEYTMEYVHETKNEVYSNEITYVRTIISRYDSGEKINEFTQNAYADNRTTELVDQVTGRILNRKTELVQSGSKNYKLPEYVPQDITGSKPDTNIIREINVLTDKPDRNITVYIVYKKGSVIPTPTPTPTPNSGTYTKTSTVTTNTAVPTQTQTQQQNKVVNTADNFKVVRYATINMASVVVIVLSAYVLINNDKKKRKHGKKTKA